MRKVLAVAGLLAVLGMATPALAVPILSGEATLHGVFAFGAAVRVDFEVFGPGDAGAPLGATPFFQYVYQLEATTGNNSTGQPNDIGSFTITTPISFFGLTATPGNLVIGSEINPVTGNPLTCCVAPVSTTNGGGTASWTFGDPIGKIQQDGQSTLLIGVTNLPPNFVSASALDGLPGSPWSTLAGCGSGETCQVPGPAPEPASLLLFGTGLVGLTGAVRRYRRRSHPA